MSGSSTKTGLIIAVIILFLLIFILFLGVFSLSGTTAGFTTDINDLNNTTTSMSYSNGLTTFSDNLAITGGLTLGKITNLSSSIDSLQTDTTAMSYANNITNFTGSVSVADILTVDSINYSTSFTNLSDVTTNMTYDTGLTTFNDDVKITGNLAVGSITDVESLISDLQLTTTSANEGVIYAPESSISLKSLSVSGISTTNGINNTGNVSTGNFSITETLILDALDITNSLAVSGQSTTNGITDKGISTFDNLTVNNTFSAASSGLSVTAPFSTSSSIRFGTNGTLFKTLQMGFQLPVSGNNDPITVPFISGASFLNPPCVIGTIGNTPLQGETTVTINIKSITTTEFTYQLVGNDDAVNNGIMGFSWMAFG